MVLLADLRQPQGLSSPQYAKVLAYPEESAQADNHDHDNHDHEDRDYDHDHDHPHPDPRTVGSTADVFLMPETGVEDSLPDLAWQDLNLGEMDLDLTGLMMAGVGTGEPTKSSPDRDMPYDFDALFLGGGGEAETKSLEGA